MKKKQNIYEHCKGLHVMVNLHDVIYQRMTPKRVVNYMRAK